MGHIRLIVSAKPGSAGQTALKFMVSDTGKGIDPQDQAIFNAFEQRDERPGSVGLGLYIARTAVRNMGGELILDSASGVTGSTFMVHLPTQSLSRKTVTLPTQVWDNIPISRADSSLTSVPASDSLQTLGCLAANGELSEIERWLETQSSEQPAHANFYKEVHLALQRLDFTRIESLAGLKA